VWMCKEWAVRRRIHQLTVHRKLEAFGDPESGAHGCQTAEVQLTDEVGNLPMIIGGALPMDQR